MKIVCFSSNKSFTCRYPNYLHVRSIEEIETLEKFMLVLDLSSIKDDEDYFFECIKTISTCKAIFCLTCNPNFAEGTRLLALGINGYGNIHMNKINLEDALKTIRNGNIWLYPEFLQMMITSFSKNLHCINMCVFNLLSNKEKEVASLIKEGMNNKEVTQRLNITERTVKAHLSSIYKKLHVKDRVGLVIKLSTNVQ